jgi:hypothetical protein
MIIKKLGNGKVQFISDGRESTADALRDVAETYREEFDVHMRVAKLAKEQRRTSVMIRVEYESLSDAVEVGRQAKRFKRLADYFSRMGGNRDGREIR